MKSKDLNCNLDTCLILLASADIYYSFSLSYSGNQLSFPFGYAVNLYTVNCTIKSNVSAVLQLNIYRDPTVELAVFEFSKMLVSSTRYYSPRNRCRGYRWEEWIWSFLSFLFNLQKNCAGSTLKFLTACRFLLSRFLFVQILVGV